MDKMVLGAALSLMLVGCATCREHPKVCATVVTVVAAGVIYGASTHHTDPANHCAHIGLQC